MAELECRPLDGSTWAAFADLVDRHDGICVGWCQFGPAAELPRIKNRRAYEQGLVMPPDWRITCFFVDKAYRRSGVASVAMFEHQDFQRTRQIGKHRWVVTRTLAAG